MSHATLLVELLTEELPARGLRELGERLGRTVADALAKAGFVPADAPLATFATPRRIAFALGGVARIQPEQQIERKGPSVSAAWKDGAPTPALTGFARSCGVPIESLERTGEGKAECFVFRTTRAGEPLDVHLPALVEGALKGLPAHKLMRWGSGETEFIRPIHGLVMLWGAEVLPGTVMGLEAGRTTRGHRFLGESTVSIDHADDYAETLRRRGHVMADFAARAAFIGDALTRAAGDATLADPSLIEEVTALVELPAVYEGRFDPAFLAVPQECLMLTMKANQKYFPLLDAGGRLLERFLIVSNMPIEAPAHIVHGNERVLRARLSDARFFFDQDRKGRLDSLVEPLASVVHHNKLGTQRDRTARIVTIAEAIARQLGQVDMAAVSRAALLCKADLLTGMVGEFPELQGTMGMYYARHDGEAESVSRAIEAHYRPRGAGAPLPEEAVGDCVALADKLDTLAGIYGIGLIPTGDKDPFGLRRAALGVVRILVEHRLALDLDALLEAACAPLADRGVPATLAADLRGFIHERLRSWLRDQDHPADEIDAVLALAPTRLDTLPAILEAVHAFRALPEAEALAAANKRIGNILRKSTPASAGETAIDPSLLLEAEERALADELARVQPLVDADLAAGRVSAALTHLAALRGPVDAFFDKVLVNAPDERLRDNRLALLTGLNRLMNGVADLSRLAS
jgi:glycyl-tRNA synthetase beta chain